MMNINNQKLLNLATALCKQRCVRLTPQRLAVLKLISQQNKPIGAYDLLNIFKKHHSQAKPITIYRALNFLLIQGLIHRVESTNKFLMCHYLTKPSHNFAFLICDCCNNVIEKSKTGIEKTLQYITKISGFKMSYNIIEAHGTCQACIKKIIHIKTRN